MSQEGAMVLVEVHRAVLRVNQSKVRRDHDPWHDVAVPLKSDDGSRRSSSEEALDHIGDKILEGRRKGRCLFTCYEHEICYHTLTSAKSDFVEISPTSQGLRLVLAILAVLPVRLFCLAIGLLRPCNHQLLVLGRIS